MCDYSLHNVATRPAQIEDKLVTTKFRNSITRGFAAVGEPHVAVCLQPAKGYATHAGVSATMVIACVTLPAIVSLKADMKSAAASISKNGPSSERDWLQKNQLEFATASGLMAVLTTAAPMLTSPIVDMLGTLPRS
jgi:hypothetical protein